MFTTDFGLGTLISNLSNTYGTGASAAKAAEARRRSGEEWNVGFQREQFGPDLLAKVEAAKAAGLHPLAALGGFGGGAMSSPIVSSNSPVPQFSYSSDKEVDPDIEAYNRARARLATSEADMAELNYRQAVERLASQPGQPTLYTGGSGGGRGGRGLVVPEGDQFRFPGLRGAVSVEAMRIPSASNASRAVTAGDSPGWQPFRFTDGSTVMLPYAGEGQTFMGQSPVAGMVMAVPQYLWQKLPAVPYRQPWEREAYDVPAAVKRWFDSLRGSWGRAMEEYRSNYRSRAGEYGGGK